MERLDKECGHSQAEDKKANPFAFETQLESHSSCYQGNRPNQSPLAATRANRHIILDGTQWDLTQPTEHPGDC
ncbi:unnamed protein product [Arctogadus glacialis]